MGLLIAVEHYEFDANIARKYIPTIEVTHSSQITGIPYKPSVVVAFNQHLFHKAIQIYKDYEHTVYYRQEDEARDFSLRCRIHFWLVKPLLNQKT